jgi:hypothetical protein
MLLFGGVVPIKHTWKVARVCQKGWCPSHDISLWESPSTWLTAVSFSTVLERGQKIKLTESLEIDVKVTLLLAR